MFFPHSWVCYLPLDGALTRQSHRVHWGHDLDVQSIGVVVFEVGVDL